MATAATSTSRGILGPYVQAERGGAAVDGGTGAGPLTAGCVSGSVSYVTPPPPTSATVRAASLAHTWALVSSSHSCREPRVSRGSSGRRGGQQVCQPRVPGSHVSRDVPDYTVLSGGVNWDLSWVTGVSGWVARAPQPLPLGPEVRLPCTLGRWPGEAWRTPWALFAALEYGLHLPAPAPPSSVPCGAGHAPGN